MTLTNWSKVEGVERKMHFHYWLSIPKQKPLPLQKVMHTRKRHMELFQELNQKFQTLDRFRDIPNMGSMVSNRKPRGAGSQLNKEINFQIIFLDIWCRTHLCLIVQMSGYVAKVCIPTSNVPAISRNAASQKHWTTRRLSRKKKKGPLEILLQWSASIPMKGHKSTFI